MHTPLCFHLGYRLLDKSFESDHGLSSSIRESLRKEMYTHAQSNGYRQSSGYGQGNGHAHGDGVGSGPSRGSSVSPSLNASLNASMNANVNANVNGNVNGSLSASKFQQQQQQHHQSFSSSSPHAPAGLSLHHLMTDTPFNAFRQDLERKHREAEARYGRG